MGAQPKESEVNASPAMATGDDVAPSAAIVWAIAAPPSAMQRITMMHLPSRECATIGITSIGSTIRLWSEGTPHCPFGGDEGL
jgi:hypothetical protein